MRYIIPNCKPWRSKPRALLCNILNVVPWQWSILRDISHRPSNGVSNKLILFLFISIYGSMMLIVENWNKFKIWGVAMKKCWSNLVHYIPAWLFIHLLSRWKPVSLCKFPQVLSDILKLFLYLIFLFWLFNLFL